MIPGSERLPEPEVRRRVLCAIIDHPGLHVRGLARYLEIAPSLVDYHAAGLLDAALITEATHAGYRRFYPRPGPLAPSLHDSEALALLHEPVPLHIVLLLLHAGVAVTHGGLAEKVDVVKSTLSFHLAKLTEAGVVEHLENGLYTLRDAPRLHRLVLRHRPPPELMDDVWPLWLGLYRSA